MRLFLLCFLAAWTRDSASQAPETSSLPPPPPTSFSCHGRPPGYYADLETGCRTYHVCDGNSHFTYVCPKRTLFQQRSRICDHSYLVRCEDSVRFFEGEDFYPEDEEEILSRLAESDENETTEGTSTVKYNQLEETKSTETTPYSITTLTTTTEEEEEKTTEIPNSIQTTTATVVVDSNDDYVSQALEKFLKVKVSDFRSLFFIPEVDNNLVLDKSEREYLLPVDKTETMRFRNSKKIFNLYSACPGYCNPKFFLPGTCHPCIMIK